MNKLGRHRDYSGVDDIWYVFDRSVSFAAKDLRIFGVDRIDSAFVAADD